MGLTADGTYDVVVVGAGITGLYTLHRLRQRGLAVRVLDAAPGVGGTWYWNKYPGCRFDSESFTYGYSFSDELLQEWDWKERYAAQPDTERYLNHVADKFELRRDIQLATRVVRMAFDSGAHTWTLTTQAGEALKARFVITAVGFLSAHYVPQFEGLDHFEGRWCHPARWPAEGLDLAGKRVGVVGTGATGVQLISAIAADVGHLTVFQRTANYCLPLRNRPIDRGAMQEIKACYPDIFRTCLETPHGFVHKADARSAMAVAPHERTRLYEKLWDEPGFAKFMCNFHDVMLPGAANEDYAEFVRGKIRARVKNPAVAQMLVPRDHPFGSKRVPCETGYYEVYNRANVTLVDVRATPIRRILRDGIETTDAKYPLDVIVFATGYDAVTGALDQMDIRGEDGLTLKEKFKDGPRTFLGMQSVGFPNLFTVNAAGARNHVRVMEPLVDWIVECIGHVVTGGFQRIEPTREAEDGWTAHVIKAGAGLLRAQADNWFFGANIPRKPRFLLTTPDPAPVGRAQRAEIAANGYRGFAIR
jgi:cation diffusion facilitator CzcD-associated flavoprotein CzcO